MPGATRSGENTILAQIILISRNVGHVLLQACQIQPGVRDDLIKALHIGLLVHNREILQTVGAADTVGLAELAVEGRTLTSPPEKPGQPALLQLLKLRARPVLVPDQLLTISNSTSQIL